MGKRTKFSCPPFPSERPSIRSHECWGGLFPWIEGVGRRSNPALSQGGPRFAVPAPPPPLSTSSLPFRAGSTSLPSALSSISVFYLLPYLLYSRSSLGPPYMGGDPPSPRGAGSYSFSSVTRCFQGTWGAGGVVCHPLVVTGVVIRSFLQYIVVILEFPGVGILSDLVCFPGYPFGPHQSSSVAGRSCGVERGPGES